MSKENYGAFVEMDVNKLSREGLVLMGMREALDKWIHTLRDKADDQPHPGVKQVMLEISDFMALDRDGIAVELARQAISDKAGTLNDIRKD